MLEYVVVERPVEGRSYGDDVRGLFPFPIIIASTIRSETPARFNCTSALAPASKANRAVLILSRMPSAFHAAWAKATPSSARYFPLGDPLPVE